MNWKTTLAGIGALLVAVGHAMVGAVHGDFSTLATDIPAVVTAIGLIFAADAAK